MSQQSALREAQAEEERIDDELAPLSDEAALRRRVTRQLNKRNEFRAHALWFVVVNVMLMALFFAIGVPWVAGIVALSWGSGLAAHGIDTYHQTGKRAAVRTARTHQAFRDEYGPRWYETASERELRDTLKRVERPTAKRREFVSHLAVFIGINAMLWWIWASVMLGEFAWPLFVTAFWGVGLAAHAIDAFGNRRAQTSIEREVERQRALMEEAQWDDEKPKNVYYEPEEPAMTIGPDGELVELTDEEWSERQKRKRQ
jgi:ABC-type multidrug transport system fused ATPase/permease subunit